MEQYAKGWKSPEERRAAKSEACAPKGKDSPDSKGPTANAWKKGLGKGKS